MANQSSPLPQRRARQVLACAQCRRRKLKCDRTTPCNRCVKSLCPESCIYTTYSELKNSESNASLGKRRRTSIPTGSSEGSRSDHVGLGLGPETGSELLPACNTTREQDDTRELQSHLAWTDDLVSEKPPLHTRLEDAQEWDASDHSPRKDGLRNQHMKNYLHGKEYKTKVFGRTHWTSTFAQVSYMSLK